MALAHPVVEAVQVVFLAHQHAGRVAHRVQAFLVDLADRRVFRQHLLAAGDDVVDIGLGLVSASGGNSHSAMSSVCSGPSGTSRSVRT